MRKILQRRIRAIGAVAISLLLVAAPATALAAESSAPASGEAPTATGAPTESGWVDQGSGGSAADSPSSEAQRGSSLGSGGGAGPSAEVEPSPAPTFTPAPPAPEAPALTPTGEEVESTLPVTPTDEVAEAPAATAPAEPPAEGIAGGASVIEGSASAGSEDAAVPLLTVPASGETEGKSSSVGAFPLVLAILLILGLVGWLGWLAVRHLRSHLRWRREAAEWKTAVRKLERAQRPELVLRRVSGNGAQGRRPARGKRDAPAQDAPAKPAKVH